MPQRSLEQSWREQERPSQARVLALLNLVSGVVLVNGAFIAPFPGAPVTLYRVLVGVALVQSVCLFTFARCVPFWILHALLALYSVLVGVLAAVAVRELAVAALAPSLIVIGMYSGYFLAVPAMIAHLTTAIAAFVIGAANAAVHLRPMDFAPALLATVTATWVLAILTHRLRSANSRDALTGTFIRSAWLLAAERMLDGRVPGAASVTLIDLDHFKQINDTDGHQRGDDVLQSVAASWIAVSTPRRWLLGRWGGDEFVLLVRAGGRAGADEAVRLLRESHPVQFTVGTSVDETGRTSVAEMIQRADADLLASKRRRPDEEASPPGR